MSLEKVAEGESKGARGFLTWGNLRDLLVIVFLTICAFRLAMTDIVIDLTGFKFTDLLSMILAISAIALSAAFYFKADETSRGFYNNTYRFTKEVSEILGRIEAGFGEKLRHIDEGYNGLSEKFDRMPFDRELNKVDEKNKEAEIQEQEAKRQDIIEDLMQKADLADGDKRELLSKLVQLSEELDKSRNELARFRSDEVDHDSTPEVSKGFISYLSPFVKRYFSDAYKNAPSGVLINRFKRVLADEDFNINDASYMEKRGLLKEGRLTGKGVSLIRYLLGETD